jgi:hypothetical protein
MMEGEEKYHKQWARTVASKTLVAPTDGEEVEGEHGKEER